MWQYYGTNYPGQVKVLGVDMYNGNSTQVQSFVDETGVTFPILMLGSSATGGNVSTLYGPWDNYLVIDQQQVVRYHAANIWPHGNRYHLDQIKNIVNGLVTTPAGVGDPPRTAAVALSASPNPFRAAAHLDLTLATDARSARVTVVDLAGRRMATLHDGALGSGVTRFSWDGRGVEGDVAPAGVYLVTADLDGRRLQKLIVRIR